MEKHLNNLKMMLDEFEPLKKYINPLNDIIDYSNDPTRILIMGEFSVGKSSIINALLGSTILSTSLVPTTALTTMIKYDENERLEILYTNRNKVVYPLSDIDKWTSEREKGHQTKRDEIDKLTVFLNNPLLQKVVLIDSPGLNSGNSTHTDQTIKTLEMTDEVMFVFAYGKVGQVTEIETLKKLNELGHHPIGVINRMDEFISDSEDWKSEEKKYFQYEFLKFKPLLKKLIGVSALEASQISQCLSEDEEELYETSGFPNLLKELDYLASNKEKYQHRFNEYFNKYLDNLCAAISDFTLSPHYNALNNEIIKIKDQLQFSFDNFNRNFNNSEKQVREQTLSIKQTITKNKVFLDWISTFNTQHSNSQFPIDKLKRFVREYMILANDLQDYELDLKKHNESVISAVGKPIEFKKRFNADKTIIKEHNKTYKHLKTVRTQLAYRVTKCNEELYEIKEFILNNESLISNIYRKQLQRLNIDLEGRKYKIEQQMILLRQIYKKHEQPFEQLDKLLTLTSLVMYIQKEKHFSSNTNIHFNHVDSKYQLEEKISRIENKLNLYVPSSLDAFEWNHTFDFPPHFVISDITKPKNYLLGNPKYQLASVVASSFLLLFGTSLIGGEETESYERSEDEYEESYEESDEESTELSNVYSNSRGLDELEDEEPQEDEEIKKYLTPLLNNENYIGTLFIPKEIEVYDAYEGTFLNEYLTQNNSWRVYEENDNWYRIQNDRWIQIHDSSGIEYSPKYYVQQVSNTTDTLAYLTNTSDLTIYEAPGKEALRSKLAAGEDYQVISLTANGWANIGSNAWVRLDSSTSLKQFELEYALKSSKTPIKYARTKIEDIPVFKGPSHSEPIIGFYSSDVGDQIPFYSSINDGWIDLGDGAWIEGLKHLDIDWTFQAYNTGEPIIGTAKVKTIDTNVRSSPSKESNIIAVLPSQSTVDVYEVDYESGWYRIGSDSWITNKTEFITFYDKENNDDNDNNVIGTITVKSKDTNIRSLPSKESDVVGLLEAHAVVDVYEIDDETGWHRIGVNEWITNKTEFITFTPNY